MLSLLRHLLAGPTTPAVDSIDGLRERTRELAAAFPAPFDRGVATALSCDRVGFAFAAGYQAALHALLRSLPVAAAASLCATEEGGAHPRAIQTRLEAAKDGTYLLRGRKRWSTFAPAADALFVVASAGTDDRGRNRLRLVRIDRNAAGVRVDEMPKTAFAPEIPHAEVTFDGVAVREADLLEGDGYDLYLKPFRTIEDVHVFGALAAHLIGVARNLAWPRSFVERTTASIVALRAIALADPGAPEVHVALGGSLAALRVLLAETEPLWAAAPAEMRARWERDRPLLEIAGGARSKRLEAAWARLTVQ